MSRKAPGERRAEEGADRREAACCRDHHARGLRSVSPEQMHRQDAHSAADADERSFGPEHRPAAEGGEGRDDDAGKLDRRDCTGGLESLGGSVPAGSGQVADREADQQSAEREERKRPPDRCRVEPEIFGKGREEVLLRLGHALQEEVRHRAHHDSERCAQDEQPDVAPTLEELERSRRRRRR